MSLEHCPMAEYFCKACNFSAVKPSDWKRHLQTVKHKSLHPDFKQEFKCDVCEKTYAARNSLWYHKKKCSQHYDPSFLPSNSQCNDSTFGNDYDISVEAEIIDVGLDTLGQKSQMNPDLFIEVVEQNKKYQEFFMDQYKLLAEKHLDLQSTVSNSYNTNSNNHLTTNNSQTFNLQFFLNETCKNAMNLNDFIDQIEITMEDLDDMRRLGYSEGVSNILVKNLDKVAISDRPVHSNDVKREMFYIRNNNKWIKETDDYQYLIKAIKCIVKKNMIQLIKWRELNPEFNDPTTKTCEHHHQMIVNMFNSSDEEAQKNYRRIIRTVASKTPIPKCQQ